MFRIKNCALIFIKLVLSISGIYAVIPCLSIDKKNSPTINEKLYCAFLKTGVNLTTDTLVPFWLRSRQFGSVPLEGFSGSITTGAYKAYYPNRKQFFDWAAGFEGRFNVSSTLNKFLLIEGYVKGKISNVELKVGRFKEFSGLVDSTLSSGSFSISGNNLGIPKAEIGFPEYWEIPFTSKLFAVKWNFALGWFGQQQFTRYGYFKTYYHQKSFYSRFGKPHWKLKLYMGANHHAIWGAEDEVYAGNGWDLNKWETFKHVFTGKAYGAGAVPASKVGNQLGSIDQAATYETTKLLFNGYHQFFYDAGALAKLANVKDGIWGFSLQNKATNTSSFQWHKFLFEFMYSKSQGGEIDSKPRPSGFEDYYNNSYYTAGWTYEGAPLGNPFFTLLKYARSELAKPRRSYQSYTNNRLKLFHFGSEFSLFQFSCKMLLSYSQNFGNYTTSPEARGRGTTIYHFPPPYFGQQDQFSAYLETSRSIGKGYHIGLELAFDRGDLLYNSTGGTVTFTKVW